MLTQISVRTSPELIEKFTTVAQATGRTRSYLINIAMEEYIQREAWQVSEILKAVEEADRRDFVPEKEMEAFWKKWVK